MLTEHLDPTSFTNRTYYPNGVVAGQEQDLGQPMTNSVLSTSLHRTSSPNRSRLSLITTENNSLNSNLKCTLTSELSIGPYPLCEDTPELVGDIMTPTNSEKVIF